MIGTLRTSIRVLAAAPLVVVATIATSVVPGGATPTPLPAILTFTGSPTTLSNAGGATTIKATLKNGASCTLAVSPGVAGMPSMSSCSTSYSKTIALPKNPSGTVKDYTFSLSVKNATGTTKALNTVVVGVGAAPPPISFNPSVLVFGAQGVSIPSTPLSVTVTNNSTTQSQFLSQFQVGGTDEYDFSGGFQEGNCGEVITPGQSCTFAVMFSPQGNGTRSAYVAVTDASWGTGTTVDYKVQGTGQFATASLSETSLNFGSLGVKDPSAWTSVTVTNSGSVPLRITSISPVGNDASDFTYNYNQNFCAGAPITPGSSCYFQIEFTPLNAGVRSTDIEMVDNTAQGATNIPASGDGVWTTSVLSTSSLSFPSTPISGSYVDMPITITNNSTSALVFGSSDLVGNDVSDFIFVSNPRQTGDCAAVGEIIAAGLSCIFDVQFQPIAVGLRTASLEVFDNTVNATDPGYELISLSGTGTPSP